MTDQKTPLKTKAKTGLEICTELLEYVDKDINESPPLLVIELTQLLTIRNRKWVLLSDAEPLELEIQQLKKELSKEQHYKNEWKHQFLKIAKLNIEFAKQIETAKQLHEDMIKSWETNDLFFFGYWKSKLEKVFGEKTET